jgi:hypothetical protein
VGVGGVCHRSEDIRGIRMGSLQLIDRFAGLRVLVHVLLLEAA